MSIIKATKMLEEGIVNLNWTQVVEGYNLLTGESLSVNIKKTPCNPEELLEILKLMLENEGKKYFSASSNTAVLKRENIVETKTETTKSRGRPKKDKKKINLEPIETPNQPVNVGKTIFGDDTKLIQESVALSSKFTPKEYRPKFKFAKVTCAICNKQEEVHPVLAPKRLDSSDDAPRYVCNRCNGGQR